MIEELQLDVSPTHHVYTETEPMEDAKILAVARVTRDGDPPELATEQLEDAVRFSTGDATAEVRLGSGPASIAGELGDGSSFDLPP